MQYLPVFLDLKQRPCLLVGGGNVALRKLRLLLDAGALVTVVAPDIHPDIRLSTPPVEIRERAFEDRDILHQAMVIAATSNEEVNRHIYGLCQAAAKPVNVVDNPSLCSFIFPAIVDRSPIMVAISSGGQSPVLSRLVREKIEQLLPARLGDLARFAHSWRDRVRACVSFKDRHRFWERCLRGSTAELVLNGMEGEASLHMEQTLASGQSFRGMVSLVGAGPGDPDLLTMRALRVLQSADVIIYDRLVSPGILDLARRDAERIYAGKARSHHSIPQDEINALLRKKASEGLHVVRLKGGDPFIFGRGGEEIESLARAGIPFQIVPGITAASGCSAYAGIPLTHRDYAHTCLLVAGHLKDGKLDGMHWEQLAQPSQTVVIYMGLGGLDQLCEGLIRHGAPHDRPAALINRGTTCEQQVFLSDLAHLPEMVSDREIEGPALLIVGDVVRLHPDLHWFGAESERAPHSAER